MESKKTYRYPIRLASEMSGVSVFVIRSWEKRHRALLPERTQTNRRLYSDADIERLILLRQATERGHSIGTIASLSNTSLADLLSQDRAKVSRIAHGTMEDQRRVTINVSDMIAAARSLDVPTLERQLMQASVSQSQPELIAETIIPFLETVGRQWQDGLLRISHEHMATATVRTFLGGIVASSPRFENGPVALICTPVNQAHEIGALIAAATVATRGWNVVYLGANLPAEEMASAVRQLGARMLILSIVYPADDAALHRDLQKLAGMLPAGLTVAVGGRAASAYGSALKKMDAVVVKEIADLERLLDARGPHVS
jgi:MerR family transcriptional regulator, light-induced transcriptional regulator